MTTYTLTLKLNSTKDAQLIDYLQALPAGTKQAKVRKLLLSGIMDERAANRLKNNNNPPTAPAAPAQPEAPADPEPTTEQPKLTWQERLRQGLPQKAQEILAGKKIMCISGSRDMTREMKFAPERVLWNAHKEGYAILVGDAPGVDTAIIRAAQKLNIPIVVFGITEKPRLDVGSNPYIHVKRSTYHARDQIMIDLADRWIGLWNGRSYGTKDAGRYAQSRNKPATLIAYPKAQPRQSAQQMALVQ